MMKIKNPFMVVKLRFANGPAVTRRKGKNGRAAMLAASCLTLGAVCLGSLGFWRLSEDFDVAGDFFYRDGLLSHWQFWLGCAAVLQYGAFRLTRYARAGRDRMAQDIVIEDEQAASQRTAAKVG